MYFTSLPDHTQPGFDENLHFSKFKKHNIIFHAQSMQSHCDNHVGCLSFKTILSGEEWYRIKHHQLAIRPGQFLILNDDQTYSSRIDQEEKAETFSIFFKKEFAQSVFRDAIHHEDTLLGNPHLTGEKTPEFFQTLNTITPELQLQLYTLITAMKVGENSIAKMDEHLMYLLQYLIQVHHAELKKCLHVDALKMSTRTEIYKRLCIAKDILHSSYMDELDLESLSLSACLSVSQLVRQFKSVFKITPYQYLIRIRMDQAVALLKTSKKSVQEIAWLIGFENVSAFCRTFKSVVGVTPIHFRKMTR